MAWEWSHTPEGLEAGRESLAKQSRTWLRECWSEIEGIDRSVDGELHSTNFSEAMYQAALIRSADLADDALVEAIWEFAEEYRTATNGGYALYMCPYGCHTVTMD